MNVWLDLEDEERENALETVHKQMLQIDKPVKVYLDSEYVDTVSYSLIVFVKEESPNKLLTWIPDNFEMKQDFANYLDKYTRNEMLNN